MTAAQLVSSQEPGWRARYTLAAARRLAAGIENGDYPAALAREAYRAAHIAAGKNRRAAARKLPPASAGRSRRPEGNGVTTA
jgi:hypothetical protein